jgi:hypothetical protein
MDEIALLRDEMRRGLGELRMDIIRLEAKIDTKPGLMAMFTAILVTIFGMAAVIASTVAALHTLGFIGR